jgi:hypothetical protein
MELLKEAEKARDKLASLLLNDPEVSLVDIGLDRDASGGMPGVVVRVHLRKPSSRPAIEVPNEVDGVPIRIIIADYSVE